MKESNPPGGLWRPAWPRAPACGWIAGNDSNVHFRVQGPAACQLADLRVMCRFRSGDWQAVSTTLRLCEKRCAVLADSGGGGWSRTSLGRIMSPVHIRCASPLQGGTPGWSRTNTPPLKRRLLCQSSYRRMEPSAGVQPASRAYEARVLALDDDGNLVPGDRVERSSLLCKSRVLPLDEPGMLAGARRLALRSSG